MRLNIVLIIAVLLSISLDSKGNNINQIKQQCNNITPQQRQMAKAAGYDVDSLCSSVRSSANQASSAEYAQPVQTVVPRNAQLITSPRGTIESATSSIPAKDKGYQSSKLKRYGYDLFAGTPTTFAPVTNIPIPVDYIVGPGDSFQIELLGKLSQSYEVSVNRNGAINFPELGPISVAGLKYTQAKELIEQKIAEQMIGVRGVITLGELRSIRVFVLGEAYTPGSYTVSSLSTITNAIIASGGITEIGSLRKIQLKRQDKVVATLDLYDFLQKGDTTNDVRLLPGDVIYIPTVGDTVGIKGEVKRPAIYELKDNKSLRNLIRLAGGYSANAFPNISHISRKHKNGYTTVVDVDLSKLKSNRQKVKNGDVVEVSTVLQEMDNIVKLSGAFQRPRAIQWSKGLRLSDVVNSVKDFKGDVDLNIGLIVRQELPLKHISVLHFDLKGILAGDKNSDVVLQPMDEVLTFAWATNEGERTFEQELMTYQQEQQKLRRLEQVEIDSNQKRRVDSGEQADLAQELEEKLRSHNRRTAVLVSIIKRLKEQTSSGGLIRIVDVSGNIRFPGTYPLTKEMTARDLVLLAGGLKEASYLGNAEITRRDLSNNESAKIVHFNINLSEELTGKEEFSLAPKDKLAVYTTPEYREKLAIQLEGEVRFPGLYEFRRGETLSQVIERAGGFTSMAHINAAIFTRRDLKIQEAKRLEELKMKMREDIAASELENAEAGRGGAIQDAEALLNALTKSEAIGRLVVSLEDIVTGRTDDIHLKDGDRLLVPTFRQEVSVVGEVQHSTSHLFNDEWTLDDYLEKSGGYTQRADDDRIYVVRADGSVFLPNQSNWLSHQNEMLNPGDTIVVPLDTDRIKSLSLWTSVSQIVYQLALGAAAISNLNN